MIAPAVVVSQTNRSWPSHTRSPSTIEACAVWPHRGADHVPVADYPAPLGDPDQGLLGNPGRGRGTRHPFWPYRPATIRSILLIFTVPGWSATMNV